MPPATSGAASAGRSAASARDHLLRAAGSGRRRNAGYDLEDVTVTSAGRRSLVRVIVDADGGVDLDAVAAVSRAVSEALDADAEADRLLARRLRARGQLAGVDRPLTEPRHWRRAVGRLVHGRRRRSERSPAASSAPTTPGVRVERRRHRARRRRGPSSVAAGAGGVQPRRRRCRATDGEEDLAMVTVDLAALRSIEREKEISFEHAARRARDRAADRLQAHRALDAARPGRDRPQDRRGRRLGPGARRRTARSSRSTTTPRPTSAGSPR